MKCNNKVGMVGSSFICLWYWCHNIELIFFTYLSSFCLWDISILWLPNSPLPTSISSSVSICSLPLQPKLYSMEVPRERNLTFSSVDTLWEWVLGTVPQPPQVYRALVLLLPLPLQFRALVEPAVSSREVWGLLACELSCLCLEKGFLLYLEWIWSCKEDSRLGWEKSDKVTKGLEPDFSNYT